MARPPAIETETGFWLALNIQSLGLTDDQFYRFCRDNPDYRFEISEQKELIIMAPTTPNTGQKNAKLIQRLANWAEQDGTGECFDSSTEFTLPNDSNPQRLVVFQRLHQEVDARIRLVGDGLQNNEPYFLNVRLI